MLVVLNLRTKPDVILVVHSPLYNSPIITPSFIITHHHRDITFRGNALSTTAKLYLLIQQYLYRE
jgi:hypothetical protein